LRRQVLQRIAGVLGLGALALSTTAVFWDGGASAVIARPHVLVVMEENKGYGAVIGSASAPYINSLAKTYASDTSWYGVRHPSLPNYLAVVSGSTWGITTDCTTCGPFAGPSLGGQLSAAGIPWKGYLESMPSACYAGASSGAYVKRHNPFAYFKDVLASSCSSHVVAFTSFGSDLASSAAPDFAWVTPNLNDDMHDGTVSTGDTWLKNHIGPILSSPWFTNHESTLIITMDEHTSDNTGCCNGSTGGHVPLVIVSNHARGVGSFSSSGDLYGTLRSVEKSYGLGLLGATATTVHGDVSAYFGGLTNPTASASATATIKPTATPTPSATRVTFTDTVARRASLTHAVRTALAGNFTVDLTWTPSRTKTVTLQVTLSNGTVLRSVSGTDGTAGLHILLSNAAVGSYVVRVTNSWEKAIATQTSVTHY